jgi:predicted TPR repeat methyltransferase
VGFALQHFQEAARLQPQNEAIRYTVTMLSQNQQLHASPPDYIKTLFDAYADHYEPHLLQSLEYRIPELLFEAVRHSAPTTDVQWDILDLGCGTGLCGMPFKPLAKTLAGVDLSPNMLQVAAQKQIYDELIAEDLSTFLAAKHTAYDLVIAGDVFVYIGKLDELFASISQALRDNGLLAFNTEMTDKADYTMNQSGRFAHQKSYLDNLAEQHHFQILHYEKVMTRQQNNEPVHGHLYVLQKK